ncbi:c-type cytochrome domain-containing protein [Sorangium sp. So ce726]|uniref:c-type cytochrome domain-containing protein n=1 Tax=Sorangium sp. So ce726 TaxID=3133319 RepID=UPI003F60D7B2
MTYIAFLGGRTALAVAAMMSGAALIISCAGTLEDKDQYLAGGDGPGGGSGQGTPAATSGGDPATTSGGDPATTSGGDPATTSGGGDPATTSGGDPATTSASSGGGAGCAEAQALVMAKCATSGCHDGQANPGGLDLTTGWETRVAGQASTCGGSATVVVPGDPDGSLLYQKVTDDPPCNNKMPLGPALSADEMKCLYDYIAALPP